MPYEAHYINPLLQFGKQNFDLLLTDTDGLLPTIRLPMKFPVTVTDDELITAAELAIDQVLAEQAEVLP